jgi:polyhydroxybutyrate depolymerase
MTRRHLPLLPLFALIAAACSTDNGAGKGSPGGGADDAERDESGGSGDTTLDTDGSADADDDTGGSGDLDAGTGDGSGSVDTGPVATPWPDSTPRRVGGTRPATVFRPTAFDPEAEYPLVILLHGYGASGSVQNLYLGLSRLVDALGFVLLVPDGTPNRDGQRYWNATPACCAFGEDAPDDVAYIRGLADEAIDLMPIDTGRLFIFGHSNGGFMGYRLLCEASDLFTAVASLAGANYADPADCTPATTPVSLLQVHGTDDDTIEYGGSSSGPLGISFPAALDSARQAALTAGCDGTSAAGPALDMLAATPGDETSTLRFEAGCPDGIDVQLWTIDGGVHIPLINPGGTRLMLEWLLSHDRTP